MERRDEDRIYENERWVDNHRKFIIDNRLRRDNTVKVTNANISIYQKLGGFVFYWDYVMGLPRRTNYSQLIFGIFNG